MYFSCKHIDLLIQLSSGPPGCAFGQYLPVGFLFVPLTMAAYVGMPAEKSNAAAGLINFLTRNIGQSVGTLGCDYVCLPAAVNIINRFSPCTRTLPGFAAVSAGP